MSNSRCVKTPQPSCIKHSSNVLNRFGKDHSCFLLVCTRSGHVPLQALFNGFMNVCTSQEHLSSCPPRPGSFETVVNHSGVRKSSVGLILPPVRIGWASPCGLSRGSRRQTRLHRGSSGVYYISPSKNEPAFPSQTVLLRVAHVPSGMCFGKFKCESHAVFWAKQCSVSQPGHCTPAHVLEDSVCWPLGTGH